MYMRTAVTYYNLAFARRDGGKSENTLVGWLPSLVFPKYKF
jgi:hypothetical protein